MSPPFTRRKVVGLCSAGTIASLAGCQGLTSPFDSGVSEDTTSNDGTKSLGLAYSESHPSYPSEEEVHSGWVHIVSDGESADLTFDARLCSEFGEVEPKVLHSIGNEYTLRFDVSAELDGTPSPEQPTSKSSCSSVTHIVGGANIPSEWEALVVEANNTEIQSITRSGTMPELRPLPDPIRL